MKITISTLFFLLLLSCAGTHKKTEIKKTINPTIEQCSVFNTIQKATVVTSLRKRLMFANLLRLYTIKEVQPLVEDFQDVYQSNEQLWKFYKRLVVAGYFKCDCFDKRYFVNDFNRRQEYETLVDEVIP